MHERRISIRRNEGARERGRAKEREDAIDSDRPGTYRARGLLRQEQRATESEGDAEGVRERS